MILRFHPLEQLGQWQGAVAHRALVGHVGGNLQRAAGRVGEQLGAAVAAAAVGQLDQQFGGMGHGGEQGEHQQQGAHGQVFRDKVSRQTLANLAGRVPAA
ncbi:hypothetical protein D3C81_1170240 [compost metagenome]